jgi:hypothetical protein
MIPITTLGLTGRITAPATLVTTLLAAIELRRRQVSGVVVKLFGLTSLYIFTSYLAFLYTSELTFLLTPIYLVVSIILLSLFDRNDMVRFTEMASSLMVWLIIFAWIGFLLAASGFQPVYSVEYQENRTSYLYFTTLTNEAQQFIRPSGLFDEPGAFSFVICILAFARFVLGLDEKRTMVILFGGLITMSLSHVVFMVGYFVVASGFSRRLKIMALPIMLISLILVFFSTDPTSPFGAFLSRFELTSEGLSGDTRTILIRNALGYASEGSVNFWTGSLEFRMDGEHLLDRYGYLGTNPVTPILSSGILGSWPYYGFLTFGVLSLLAGRAGMMFFLVTLLYWQRPYLLSLGYSALGIFALVLYTRFSSRKYPHERF